MKELFRIFVSETKQKVEKVELRIGAIQGRSTTVRGKATKFFTRKIFVTTATVGRETPVSHLYSSLRPSASSLLKLGWDPISKTERDGASRGQEIFQ